jgi:hypothetical protein
MNLASLIISLPLAPMLIVVFGVEGLIISYLISRLVSGIYGLRLAHQRYSIKVNLHASVRIVTAALGSTLLTFLLLRIISSANPMIRLIAGALLFLVSFLFFAPLIGALDQVDIENLNTILKVVKPVYPIVRFILAIEKRILSYKRIYRSTND